MSAGCNNQRSVRAWSKPEETLLYDIWESNLKNLDTALMKDIYNSMQSELCLHFDISLKDMVNKMNNVRRRYRKALINRQYREQWEPFKRIHSFLKECKKNNKGSPHSAQNGNSTDESIYTVDDSLDYTGGDYFDVDNDCELDANDLHQSMPAASEYADEVIVLEDDIDETDENRGQNINNDNTTDSNAFQPNEYEETCSATETLESTNTTFNNNLIAEQTEKQYAPIQAVQSTSTSANNPINIGPLMNNFQNFRTNFEQTPTATALNTNFAQRVFLCQPVQPQQNAPVSIANPNSTQTLNLLPTNSIMQSMTNETSLQSMAKPKNTKPKVEISDNSDEMLKKLQSIDERMRKFFEVQENLSRQIYREGLQQTVLMTRILEEEQRRTKLLETLVKRNQ